MEITVALEHRFVQSSDGTVWTQTMFALPFWERYLEVFGRVKIVARIKQVDVVPLGWLRVNGPDVIVHRVPYYLGPLQYIMQYVKVRRALRHAVHPDSALLLRVPSQVATSLISAIDLEGRPFGVEVVGDPFDQFAPGANSHLLRPVFRRMYTGSMRRQVSKAAAAAFVTETALQRRYIPAYDGITASFSDVELPACAFISKPRVYSPDAGTFRLITVGTLEANYKRVDVLIDVMGELLRRGIDVQLRVVGDGRLRAVLEEQVVRQGLTGSVRFLGQLTAGVQVREQLDSADLFVMASQQEGLPRAMVEAMARGLPVVGTRIGGIPELIGEQAMVEPGNAFGLAEQIASLIGNPTRLSQISERNLGVAHRYAEEEIRQRRLAFYHELRRITSEFQLSRIDKL